MKTKKQQILEEVKFYKFPKQYWYNTDASIWPESKIMFVKIKDKTTGVIKSYSAKLIKNKNNQLNWEYKSEFEITKSIKNLINCFATKYRFFEDEPKKTR